MRLFGLEISRAGVTSPVAPLVTAAGPVIPGFPQNNYGVPAQPIGVGITDANLDDRVIQSDPRELWFLSLPQKLTPQQCLNILRSGLGGDVWQTWQLLSLMLDTWPTFRMAQHQLREAVSYTKFNFSPYCSEGQEPTPSAIEKAALVTRAMKGLEPDQFTDERGTSGMIYDFCDAMLNGLCVNELMWEQTNGEHGVEWLPRASAWVHPRHFTFTPEGHVSVYSDDWSKMYPDTQLASRLRVVNSTPPQDKFICSQFISRSGSSLGAGFMRPLVWYWAARQFNNEWMLNTAKQYGTPFIDITFRPGQSPDSERKKLEEFMRQAGPERRLIHPEGTLATIHPAQSLGVDNPQRYLCEEADRACLFLLLGQSHTTMSTPGKLGEEGTHADIKDERVMGLANWVARNPLRQFARAVLRVNYGNADECPNVEPDFTKPLTCSQVSQLATSLSAARVPVRADEFFKKIGFSQPQEGDVVFADGRQTILGPVLTQEEQAEQEFEQQMAMYQAQNPPGAKVEDDDKDKDVDAANPAPDPQNAVRAALAKATPAQLDELEGLVLAAEAAEPSNGEWKAVKIKVAQLAEVTGGRIKFDEVVK